MPVHVFIRMPSPADKELLYKMFTAANITEWILHDLSTEDINKAPVVDVGIAIGKVCERIVKGKARMLFDLPLLKQLTPIAANTEYRKQAWDILQRVKKILDGEEKVNEQNGETWKHVMVYLPGGRKLCVYENEIPIDVQADIFIHKQDCELLLKLKEAFGAEGITYNGE